MHTYKQTAITKNRSVRAFLFDIITFEAVNFIKY